MMVAAVLRPYAPIAYRYSNIYLSAMMKCVWIAFPKTGTIAANRRQTHNPRDLSPKLHYVLSAWPHPFSRIKFSKSAL